jgi:hypothetical protein
MDKIHLSSGHGIRGWLKGVVGRNNNGITSVKVQGVAFGDGRETSSWNGRIGNDLR